MTSFEKFTLGTLSVSEKSLQHCYEVSAMLDFSLIDALNEYYENKLCLDAIFEFDLAYEQIKSQRKVNDIRISIIKKYLVQTTEEINRLNVSYEKVSLNENQTPGTL
jgi:hypothetical protein